MQDVFKRSLQECKPSIMAHNYNPKTAEVKTGVSPVQDQPLLHEILPYKKTNKRINKKKTQIFLNNKKTPIKQRVLNL